MIDSEITATVMQPASEKERQSIPDNQEYRENQQLHIKKLSELRVHEIQDGIHTRLLELEIEFSVLECERNTLIMVMELQELDRM